VPSTSVKEPNSSAPAVGVERPDAVSLDAAAGALSAAIEYHLTESRRLAEAAKNHRTEWRKLLQRRNQDIARLRQSGWQLARIASLYKVSNQRITQIAATYFAAEKTQPFSSLNLGCACVISRRETRTSEAVAA
jgi:hypothetical protein